METTDFINGKVTYDREGQYFWINTPKNGMQMLGELRGWGHIQNKSGKIEMDKKVYKPFIERFGFAMFMAGFIIGAGIVLLTEWIFNL